MSQSQISQFGQAHGLHESRNVRLHTRAFCNIKVHPLRSRARRAAIDQNGAQNYNRQAGISSVATSAV